MKSGDLVFCHSTHLIGRAIRWGERLRFRKGSYYNHVCTLDEWWEEDGGYWTVIQAESHGVTAFRTLEDATKGGPYTVISAPTDTNAQMDFLWSQVGDKYGFLTIASVIITLLLPKFINVMMPNTWICSAVAAEALRTGGWIHSWPDVYQVTPAQLFEVLTGEGAIPSYCKGSL